jgi:hypothetical protein
MGSGSLTGCTIEPFAEVDVRALAAWLNAIPVAEWPKMSDAAWRGSGDKCRPLAELLIAEFPGCSISGLGFFLLAPGQLHPAHRDDQPPEWVTRVHVPIITNPLASATTDDGTIHMQVGKAYRFNTRASHAVYNGGSTPRVHMVFDVKREN